MEQNDGLWTEPLKIQTKQDFDHTSNAASRNQLCCSLNQHALPTEPCHHVSYSRPTSSVGHLDQFVLTKHLYCCTGTMAQLPTYRLTTSPDCFFTRLNCFRTTGNNDGRPFFARLICFRTTDKFGGIPCRICIAILIHIEDRYDDLLHITSEISYQEDIRIIIPRCRVDFINADRG